MICAVMILVLQRLQLGCRSHVVSVQPTFNSHPTHPINSIFLKWSYIVLYFGKMSCKSYILTV